ncbi:hypothetical protein [Brachybacterium sp. AOP35-5H-19]|uniref:hypothetical protein n=1 Tax=Brachybacterium sp. AOP35-5H-19 TaxID=3457685 RepID=UPI00403476FD
MTQYFQPTVANDRNTSKRLAAAYAAAGIAAPSSFATALKRHLLTVPDVKQAAAGIASEAYTADPDTDVHEFWDSAVDQVIRAQGADALKTALASALDVQERASGTRQTARALADLKPWAERQCKALTTAAKALPAGAAALDPEAVLAADAGAALTTTRQALASLALVASIPDTAARHVGTLGYYSHVMALVDPGNPTEEVVNGLGTTINEGKLDNTLAVRKLALDAKANPDLALVDVARGTYPGVTLDPATTPATITDRATRARTAFTRRTATENEQRHVIAMR